MKRAFVIDNGVLASALVPKNTKDLLNLGDRLTFCLPHSGSQISAGERGTVAWKDAVTGGVEVLMDKQHACLSTWGNHVTLEPYGTEDILESGVCFARRSLPSIPRGMAAVAGVAMFALCATLGLDYFFVAPYYTLALTFDELTAATQIFTRVFLISGTAMALAASLS